MQRRAVLWLIAGGGASLLSSCVAAPAAGGPTNLPATVPTSGAGRGAPTTAPTTTTLSETAVPTQPPSETPMATSPPTAVPTVAPTAVPTAPTPPAFAAAVDRAMQQAIQRNLLPGGVALVRHRGAQVLLQAYGLSRKYDSLHTLSADPIPAAADTLYDLASVSKLFTTTCVLRLVEQGRLGLDEPVAQWMPEFVAGGKDSVTLRQILTHTSGMPDYLQLWLLEPTPEARMQRVLATPLINRPGSVYLYSDLGLIALGHLVEITLGASLDSIVRGIVTDPLHLTNTMYRPPVDLQPRIAPTEDEQAVGRGMVWGEVHDENAWSLGGVAGHAGVFSTAEDVGRFAQLYLDGGSLDGIRLLQTDTVAEMTRNQIPGIDWRGLGWELNQKYYMGHLASPQTYGHTGFTGTSVVIDPRRDLIVVLLTNRVHPTRNGPSMNPARMAVADAALAAAEAV